MADFPHLNLVRVIEKKPYKPPPGGGKKGARTLYNLAHRQEHFNTVTSEVTALKQAWNANLLARKDAGYKDLPTANVIPLYLQIDLTAKDIESLKSFGIEIISEEEDGFILGASADNLSQLNLRLDQFLNESNAKFKDSAASLLQVVSDPMVRVKKILSPDLFERWDQLDSIPEMSLYVAISSYLKIPDYPTKQNGQSDESYERSVANWKERNQQQWDIKKDELAMERQTQFETIIGAYKAEFIGISQYTGFDDGFGCKIRISGNGLKDFALNFPFVFNVEEHDPLEGFTGIEQGADLADIEILAPDANSPKICVIDSGIQEHHRLIAPAIDAGTSMSYVPGDIHIIDKVAGGGHGTRVAGAILHPTGINTTMGSVSLRAWLQNARILDENNQLSSLLNEQDLMREIVNQFAPTRIFNLSISRKKPESYTHMPLWAATIDKLTWENDLLFIIAAGNIPRTSTLAAIPGITNYIGNGLNYPHYLKENGSKITNPAFSSFAITVGSICHADFDDVYLKSLGSKELPSSFSRSGLGLWGMIKPDVVEYGGDYIIEKANAGNITINEHVSPLLLRSTRDGGPAVARDTVGTSFATPKVTSIIAEIQRLYPNESAMLYRALLVQSARIPDAAQQIHNFIEHYGYGLPNMSRATENSNHRITFYASGIVNPKNSDIYLIKIPNEISRPGKDFPVKIEITLSYKAEPRITRKGIKSYLSTWLDWETSKKGESLDAFSARILSQEKIEEDETEDSVGTEEVQGQQAQGGASFSWTVATRGNTGTLHGVKRQDSTVQKDWCTESSNQLPSEFAVAIKGHKGWEKDLDKSIPYSVVVSFEILNPEIDIDLYNLIRLENEIELEQEIRVDPQ